MSEELDSVLDIQTQASQGSVYDSAQSQGVSSIADSATTNAMMSRYKDGYLVANATAGFGAVIKLIGIALAVLIMMAVFAMSPSALGDSQGWLMIMGLFLAAIVWFICYLAGVLISAQGQILKASLDSAVNGSPFLSQEHKAKVMSLL